LNPAFLKADSHPSRRLGWNLCYAELSVLFGTVELH
jgi:hypothetical protein